MNDEREIRALAERIARRLEGEPAARMTELDDVRAALAEIERRLARIESQLEASAHKAPIENHPFAPISSSISHPSQERFGVGEAVAELVDYLEQEKICNLEPGKKPCDHCAMCSARGF